MVLPWLFCGPPLGLAIPYGAPQVCDHDLHRPRPHAQRSPRQTQVLPRIRWSSFTAQNREPAVQARAKKTVMCSIRHLRPGCPRTTKNCFRTCKVTGAENHIQLSLPVALGLDVGPEKMSRIARGSLVHARQSPLGRIAQRCRRTRDETTPCHVHLLQRIGKPTCAAARSDSSSIRAN